MDTQALLWFILDDNRLSKNGKEYIMNAEGSVFVSPASLWELAIKISLGKYSLAEPFLFFWNKQLQHNDFTLLNIDIKHTARLTELPFYHRDPFDRLIIAQSLEEKIPLVSSDSMFDKYTVNRIW
ncbi:type II toxin-antitoxin system VapC family toxin [Desulfonatronovibrio magnus]|uniref:type II toxin-antitoxin system VapC family toxin n=1 Tax=Desulfonatronovibrio magnus TaxID=698827 RepID=UPI0018DDA233|nr:type II toxin-antitoxin system VapC family toxin [Desulfonatronovibrio magnus]